MSVKTAAASLALCFAACVSFADNSKPLATASSVQEDNSEYKVENAVDGNMSTRWSSNFTDDEWICLDLGSEKSLSGVELSWETASGKEYKIQVSLDGKSWADAFEQKDGKGGTESIAFEKPAKAKFVKLLGIKRNTEYGYSLYEFKAIEGKADGASAKISASSAQDNNSEYKVENATDGDMSTRWSSNFSDDEWICLNLGSEKTVTGVELCWETAFGKEYKIQVSLDGKSWTDAYVQNDGKGGTESIAFAKPVKAKFVRLLGVKRGTEYGYSLYEFNAKTK